MCQVVLISITTMQSFSQFQTLVTCYTGVDLSFGKGVLVKYYLKCREKDDMVGRLGFLALCYGYITLRHVLSDGYTLKTTVVTPGYRLGSVYTITLGAPQT